MSLYLACLGLDAGAHFFDTVFRPEGLLWIATGFALTVVPVLIMGIVTFKWLKIDFGTMAGMLCGSMAKLAERGAVLPDFVARSWRVKFQARGG